MTMTDAQLLAFLKAADADDPKNDNYNIDAVAWTTGIARERVKEVWLQHLAGLARC